MLMRESVSGLLDSPSATTLCLPLTYYVEIVYLDTTDPLMLSMIEALMAQKMAKIFVINLHSEPVSHQVLLEFS